ncbi:MAG: hypothetical protein WKF88_07805 [Ferruginibacter sp.]
MIKERKDNSLLWKYAGFAGQLIVALGIAVFLGIKTDGWLGFTMPVAVLIFPLAVISALIYKVIKDTAPKK